jgi:electron transfer flavoprotein alpha subunit
MAKNTKGIEVAEIIADRCIGCQICVAECPVGAIEMVGGVARIDAEVCIGCGKCAQVCPVEAVRFEKKKRPRKPIEAGEGVIKPPSEYQGVGVFIEVADGSGAEVAWELIGKARELATKRQQPVVGLLLGHGIEGIAKEAIAFGCDEVYCIEDPLLAHYRSAPYGEALTALCQEVKPEICLIGATALGRDLSGIVATKLQTGLTADCTGLDIDEETGVLLMTRPTFGGNIMATIFCQHHKPQMSTVRPRVMKMPPRDPQRKGKVHQLSWKPAKKGLPEIVGFIAEVRRAGFVDITRTPALVVAGKGACDAAAFSLLQELAELVNGTVACSRPVVEAGLMPYERQVGQTGKTVAPKLYIGVGVSGAIQHLVGMQGAEKIIAINADPNAPIFKVADVGLVGDYTRVVPALISELKKQLAGSGAGTGTGKRK